MKMVSASDNSQTTNISQNNDGQNVDGVDNDLSKSMKGDLFR